MMTTKLSSFRPGKARIRATFGAGEIIGERVGRIDEEAGILYGVQINLEGEARGHGIYLGRDFVQQVVEQGNASKLGVKVRFGHPNMCSDALGTYLGRAKNFEAREVERTDGSKALGAFADIHLADEAADSPSGDLRKWTLSAAKNSPDTFGQSIVFTYADFYTIDADGKQRKYSEEGSKIEDESADGKVYAMMDKLLGTDFTDSPAATDGVFGAEDLAAQATELLDDHPQIMQVLTSKPEAVAEFLQRYNHALELAGKPRVKIMAAVEDSPESLAEMQKRMAGLQAAKDKEISYLSEIAKNLMGQNEALTAELGTVKTELSAEKANREKVEADLAESCKRLAKAEADHAALVGGVLRKREDEGTVFSGWLEAVASLGYEKARKQHPDLYADFMMAHKTKGGAK